MSLSLSHRFACRLNSLNIRKLRPSRYRWHFGIRLQRKILTYLCSEGGFLKRLTVHWQFVKYCATVYLSPWEHSRNSSIRSSSSSTLIELAVNSSTNRFHEDNLHCFVNSYASVLPRITPRSAASNALSGNPNVRLKLCKANRNSRAGYPSCRSKNNFQD